MLSPTQIEQFQKDGYLRGGRVLSDAEVEALQDEMARVVRDKDTLGVSQPVLCHNMSGNPEAPVWQIVKEKRATFAATPAQDARRPEAKTGWPNLFLAGDWTQTGLPATIEGALQSGESAAALACRHLSL